MCRLLIICILVWGWFVVFSNCFCFIEVFNFRLCGFGCVWLLVSNCCISGLCMVVVWVFMLVVLISVFMFNGGSMLVVLCVCICRELFSICMVFRWV